MWHFLRALGIFGSSGRKDSEGGADWETIGGWDYGGSHLENVPKWVVKAMRRVSWHDMATENKYAIFKGRHFEYRVSAYGQGGALGTIQRRPRSRRRR